MKKSKKIFAILLSLVMTVAMFMSMATTVSAATCSNGTRTQTIFVQTKANWWIPGSESITLSQTKGVRTMTQYSLFGKRTKNTSMYGTWDVTVRALDGSHYYTKRLTGGSLKLNLKPDKAYQITVSWNNVMNTVDAVTKGEFSKLPTWRVSGTWKVSNYH